MGTAAYGYIGAVPPAVYGAARWPLPEGWYWWDQDEGTAWVDDEPADDRIVVTHMPPTWVRTYRAAELAEMGHAAYRAWMGDEDGAYDLVKALPPGWHAWVMNRLGYGDAAGRVREIVAGTDGLTRGQGGSHDGLDRETWAQRVCPAGTPGATLANSESWEVVVLGRRRLARAEAGTPVPEGWNRRPIDTDRDDWLAVTAPVHMDHGDALHRWGDLTGPSTDLTVICVRPTKVGRWVAAYGMGSYARQVGETDTEQTAVALAREALAAHQAEQWERAKVRAGGRLDWTGWPDTPPEPTVVVAGLGENGWAAYQRVIAG